MLALLNCRGYLEIIKMPYEKQEKIEREQAKLKNGQITLDSLATIGEGNVSLVQHVCGIDKKRIGGAFQWLLDAGLIKNEGIKPCPITGKQTYFYSATEKGKAMANIMSEPKLDMLRMLPFTITEGLVGDSYISHFISNKTGKLYTTNIKRQINKETNSWEFVSVLCSCRAFEFRKECKHCDRLKREVKEYERIIEEG